MNHPPPNRRTYTSRSPGASARRQAAGQYNWAIHQSYCTGNLQHVKELAWEIRNKGTPEQVLDAEEALQKMFQIQNLAREVRDWLRNPETRAAWMEIQCPQQENPQ